MIQFESPQSMRWNLDRQEVRFAAIHERRKVLCRVSGEVVSHRLVIKGSNEQPLQAARRNFDILFRLARQAISRRRFEADESILLSAADFETRTAFDA